VKISKLNGLAACLAILLAATRVAADPPEPGDLTPGDPAESSLCTDEHSTCTPIQYGMTGANCWPTLFPAGCCRISWWWYKCVPGGPIYQVTHQDWMPGGTCSSTTLDCSGGTYMWPPEDAGDPGLG
jgi:hypothetical protein